MLRFVLTDLLMLSLGAILYLIVRALPRIEEDHAARAKHSFVHRLLHSAIPHKIDLGINAYAEKFFRKLKVWLMRFDNYLTHRLKKIHTNGNGNGKPKIDFKDISGDNSVAGDGKTE